MKYLILNNLHSRFNNLENGVVDEKDISNISNLNYLLASTATIIPINEDVKEKKLFLKANKDISFQTKEDLSQNRKRIFILKEGTLLNRVYIDYFNLDIENFDEIKIIAINQEPLAVDENVNQRPVVDIENFDEEVSQEKASVKKKK